MVLATVSLHADVRVGGWHGSWVAMALAYIVRVLAEVGHIPVRCCSEADSGAVVHRSSELPLPPPVSGGEAAALIRSHVLKKSWCVECPHVSDQWCIADPQHPPSFAAQESPHALEELPLAGDQPQAQDGSTSRRCLASGRCMEPYISNQNPASARSMMVAP